MVYLDRLIESRRLGDSQASESTRSASPPLNYQFFKQFFNGEHQYAESFI